MPESLKVRTFRALSWSLIQQVAVRGLQFDLGVVLARPVDPKQFGLVAMLGIEQGNNMAPGGKRCGTSPEHPFAALSWPPENQE